MKNTVQEIDFNQLSRLISDKLGLNFPKERFSDLENGLNKAKKDFDFDDLSQFVVWLLGTELKQAQIELLASHFTIGETYFFRDLKYFRTIKEYLINEIIPIHSEKDKRLRIWSAGCSTGEEAYSIAIMLSHIMPDIREWRVTIMATDLNTNSLKKASKGIYKDWSFRNSPKWLKPDYFIEESKGNYKIIEHIKNMVEFQYHNLAIDPYPSLINNLFAFDIIFCRNVMMYSSQNLNVKLIEKFYHSLNENGLLVVSPSEASHILFNAYEALYYPDVILYKRIDNEYKPYKLQVLPDEKYLPEKKEIESNSKKIVKRLSKRTNNIKRAESSVSHKKDGKISNNKIIQPFEPFIAASKLFNEGNYREAESLLKSILSNGNQNSNAIVLLAKIHGNLGQPEEAVKWCKKAIEIDKLNPGNYYLYANILLETDNTEEAVNLLKKTLYLDSKYVLAHFSLGNIFMKQGKSSESGKHFKNVIHLLDEYNSEELVPESSGITAGRLRDIINKITNDNKIRIN